MTVLAKSSAAEIEAHWKAIRQPSFQWVRRPEHGAAMARGRASGTGILFNLGEVAVTRCSVQIESGEVGVSYVVGRSKRHAALAAIFDGLMQREIAAGGTEIAFCIDALAGVAEDRRRGIVREAYGSKVEFLMVTTD
jgi:alpha-D-ribose 1-methylphosphonate 5-triphosphate synthase subunit PhnG